MSTTAPEHHDPDDDTEPLSADEERAWRLETLRLVRAEWGDLLHDQSEDGRARALAITDVLGPLSQAEVGALLGRSRQRAGAIEACAMGKLRPLIDRAQHGLDEDDEGC